MGIYISVLFIFFSLFSLMLYSLHINPFMLCKPIFQLIFSLFCFALVSFSLSICFLYSSVFVFSISFNFFIVFLIIPYVVLFLVFSHSMFIIFLINLLFSFLNSNILSKSSLSEFIINFTFFIIRLHWSISGSLFLL